MRMFSLTVHPNVRRKSLHWLSNAHTRRAGSTTIKNPLLEVGVLVLAPGLPTMRTTENGDRSSSIFARFFLFSFFSISF
jgi:hypothetical protein